jgi:hypothetical protein
MQRLSIRGNWLHLGASLSFLLPLGLYLLTLAPSVTFFDSGEFITAIYSMGSAHSPGYPLFINYVRPFLFLPFGSVAFKVNMATAVSGALACYGVYLLVTTLLEQEEVPGHASLQERLKAVVALAAALSFACTDRLWLQSNHDKPYPLISFIAAVVFWLLLRWRDHYRQGEECPAYVYAGAFLSGLAFGAHQTIILLVPAYACFLLLTDWRLITRVREVLLMVSFALMGFAIHLHLIVRATQNPLLNWGDPKSLTQFLWHLLRKGYPTDKPQRDLSLLWAQMNAFNIPYEFSLLGLFLLLFGCVVLFRRQRDLVLSYGVGIVSFLAVIAGYFNGPRDLIFLTEEFFTPLYLLSAVLIGCGLFFLVRYLVPILVSPGKSVLPGMVGIGIMICILPTTLCAVHYQKNDQHENYVAYDYAMNSLRSLPLGAVMYTWGDSGAFPMWYVQGVERMREDLDLLHTPHLVFEWYLDAFPHVFRKSRLRYAPLESIPPESALFLIMEEQFAQRPVFVDFSTRYSVPLANYDLRQRGVIYEVMRKGTAKDFTPDLDVWDRYVFRGISGDMFFRDLDTGKAILIYGNGYLEQGETLLAMGRRAEALESFRAAGRISPELAIQANQVLSVYGLRL